MIIIIKSNLLYWLKQLIHKQCGPSNCPEHQQESDTLSGGSAPFHLEGINARATPCKCHLSHS